jgi:transcription elongation factor GreA
MNKVPMTKKGRDRLQEELAHLKTVERQKIIQAIAEARAHGDLKENAEYHAAKEQQSFIEGRIAEVEGKLSNAMVIEVQKLPQNGKVVFGVTVTLINCKTEAESVYQLVGDDEADFKEGKISINSPLARAIIGKEEGDVVEVRAPGGNTDYEIGAVRYLD